MRNRITVLVAASFLSALLANAVPGQSQSAQSQSSQAQTSGSQSVQPQSSQSGNSSMPGMNMPEQDKSNMHMKDMPGMGNDSEGADNAASEHAMHSMEGHMDMGPHMKMTALRQPKPGDAARAQQILEGARKAAEKYTDYHTALNDGFRIFHPEIPQKMYHFTSFKYGWEARREFNPEHPTSLLYEKRGDDYKLIGVMYTAPKRLTEDQLDERVPLSVAQWHEHVNFCVPPLGHMKEMKNPNPQFGFRGSIATQEACDAAGGTFLPVVFNWMVHVYPFEKDQASIWSVERQHGDAD
jgi:hypothetical protein